MALDSSVIGRKRDRWIIPGQAVVAVVVWWWLVGPPSLRFAFDDAAGT